MKVSCLLTARGNNQLKDKNVLDILGKPVLYYPAKEGRESKEISSWYVSSDCEKILNIAQNLGYEKIIRPTELAQPNSKHVDAIYHAIGEIEKRGNIPEILVVILGNNITIKSKWIDDCVKIMKNDMNISAVVPVYEDLDHNPFRAKKVDINGHLIPFNDDIPTNVSTNRQELPRSYFLAHNFWVLNTKMLIQKVSGHQPWSFMGNRVVPYEIHKSIDIHEEFDLEVGAIWLRKN